MSRKKRTIGIALSVFLWIGLWTYLAYRLNKPVLLPYPKAVAQTFLKMVKDREFLRIVGGSFTHVTAGFLLALLLGIVFGALAGLFETVEILLIPGVKLVKTVPVVSFIILLLFFVKPAGIGFVISLLMVFPVVYENMRKGIAGADGKLLEAARVFRIPFLNRLAYLIIPAAVPYTLAASSAGLSLCWKAGIAAELIAQSPNSIGHELYYAKLYVDAESVFAWTAIIILVSVLFEKVFLILFRLLTVPFTAPTVLRKRGGLLRYLLGITRPKRAEGDTLEDAAADSFTENEMPDTTVASETIGQGPANAETTAPAEACKAPVAVLSGIGKCYDGRKVLNDINLSLVPGTVTVISGPSGCGKTTLLRILLGLTEADEGSREIGKDVRFAAVFQENRLAEQLSALKNMRLLPNPIAKKEAEALLTEAGIGGTAGKPVSEFSGGMKRRAAWCRMLPAESQITVLDEPFTGLDDEKKDRMIRLLYRYKKDNAIVIVTHNASEITKIREVFGGVVIFHTAEKENNSEK
ncbi:MAG: ATP-binding cassette domain-containing protein [Lachnospiraceae bacterium]|nr:ATP-binding cassette domain-containing protein [Lachnospiraceae bacterium]